MGVDGINDEDDTENYVSELLNPKEKNTAKVLGTAWDIDEFVSSICVLTTILPGRKKRLLSVTMKISDPNVVTLKILFQTVCKESCA